MVTANTTKHSLYITETALSKVNLLREESGRFMKIRNCQSCRLGNQAEFDEYKSGKKDFFGKNISRVMYKPKLFITPLLSNWFCPLANIGIRSVTAVQQQRACARGLQIFTRIAG